MLFSSGSPKRLLHFIGKIKHTVSPFPSLPPVASATGGFLVVLLSLPSCANLGPDPLVKEYPVMNPLITRMVEAFMSHGLASTGSDGRPWSRHHPAAEFARVAAEVAVGSYHPSDQEVERACEEFYDGTDEEDDWGFMILLDEPACERARKRMRRTLIRAQQSRGRV